MLLTVGLTCCPAIDYEQHFLTFGISPQESTEIIWTDLSVVFMLYSEAVGGGVIYAELEIFTLALF